jgi:hypothetical protein
MIKNIIVSKLKQVHDPMIKCPLDKKIISISDVNQALFELDLISCKQKFNKKTTRRQHIARIAWLCAYGVSEPIKLDFSKKKIIRAGWHQFIAAIIRGDGFITAEVSNATSKQINKLL